MTTRQCLKYRKAVPFFVLIIGIHGAMADGYRNPPATAEGIAKSDANKVFVNDASAVSYNPANLAIQTNASFVSAVTFAHSENTYSVAGQQAVSDDP